MCLLVSTLPQFALLIIGFLVQLTNERILVNPNYWAAALLSSNSYANAFIILYRSRGNHKPMRENKRA